MFDEANRWLRTAALDDNSEWKLSQYYLVHMPQENYAQFQQQADRWFGLAEQTYASFAFSHGNQQVG